MLDVIGKKLKQMHKEEARKLFREWLSAGNKLTYEELKNLKDEDWKFDYI